ncbi:2-polyprenyl-6-methoxyphenol hydroxylase-like FAD-dependent oxidoreductase [Asanoa ferruginea]|uniref:2-polyprenyl-6-methoxyphenol hydroxylase-like FAD-dependent oxidoreductase n=1 Tax=Asanoa ferruginea TaxID=53367 RepID=A0A3D9ZV29_9ACTN|nr:FAD-dependent monooxygenase [Asanoa ferruginea]REG01197.1 2-polyprenyl-6-methoxyphenol hydroxylase-like FAD-dependent oxidoreductase [Asanoa ferruginea]GIF47093.1 FAD-dependent oxidoreductase [Asanoa ferruginea]
MTNDVVIVGAGPTGLVLASELALAGVHPIVLERLPEPTGLSKALALVGRSVDLLERRGLLERFPAVGPPVFAHFSMLPLDLAVVGDLGVRGIFLPQAQTEEILLARALELGVEIRRGQAVDGLEQDPDGVTLTVHGQPVRARYVVGCDGGSSTVRKLAGIGFPGIAPARLLRLADFTVPAGVAGEGHLDLPTGERLPYFISGVVPLRDGYFRVITNEPYPAGFDRDAPMTVEELQGSVQRATGVRLPITGTRWMSRFTDATRQADRYRAGRVLLAGDAAHIHLPAGGPGLNTGLLDAFNLGWKLAAELHGWAPEGLLDSYHTERHAEGARVLLHTRAQGALALPDERVASLRTVFAELLQDAATTRRLAGLLYSLDTRYDMGGGQTHPLVGRWSPEIDATHTAKPMLFGAKCPGWEDRVVTVPTGDPEAMLIRPDGYVAWAGSPDDGALEPALRRWFGRPSA